MKIFDLVDYKIVITPEILNIPEFKDIWTSDKSKTKEKAMMEFEYIYYLEDYNSPYNIYPYDERKYKVIHDFIKDPKWKPNDKILKAQSKYQELTQTPLLGLLRDAVDVIQKLRDYFKKINFDIIDNQGNPIYSAKDAIANLSKLKDLVVSMKALENIVKQEQQDNTRVRGDRQTGIYED